MSESVRQLARTRLGEVNARIEQVSADLKAARGQLSALSDVLVELKKEQADLIVDLRKISA